MKTLLICLTLSGLLLTAAYAGSNITDQYAQWVVDSYEFGKDGNNCSEIYMNYGIPKWTFSSDDPKLLKQLYGACKTGKEDLSNNQNSLSKLLQELETGKQR